jgi:MFS family permease
VIRISAADCALFSLGGYCVYSFPMAYTPTILSRLYISSANFGVLFTVYSVSQLIACIPVGRWISAGHIKAVVGCSAAGVIASALLHCIVSFVCLRNDAEPCSETTAAAMYYLLVLAWLLLGGGLESLISSVATLVYAWMNHCGSSQTFAAVILVNTLGNALVFQLVPLLDPFESALMSAGVVLISAVALCMLFVMEIYVEKKQARKQLGGDSSSGEESLSDKSEQQQQQQQQQLERASDHQRRRHSSISMMHTPLPQSVQHRFLVLKPLLPPDFAAKPASFSQRSHPLIVLRQMGFPIIILLLIVFFGFGSLVSYIIYTTEILVDLYSLTPDDAAVMASWNFYMTIIMQPVSGLLIGKFGRRGIIMIFTSLTSSITMFLFGKLFCVVNVGRLLTPSFRAYSIRNIYGLC